MKTFVCLLIVLVSLQLRLVQGQNIMWQQRHSWVGTDGLTGVIPLGDGTYLAAGGGGFSGIGLLRFDADGDTLYLRQLPMSRGFYESIRLCRMQDGKVYIVNVNPRNMVLGKIDPEFGVLEWSLDLPGVGPFSLAPNPNCLIEGPNKTLIIAGDCGDPLGQAASIGYIGCFDTLGIPKWTKEVREHPTFTLCNHVERTTDGMLLVSGTAGSLIWATKLTADSGREIRRTTFYQNIPRINFDYGNAWVQQAPNNQFLVSGIIQTVPRTHFIGMFQGWAGSKIWGGEKQGRVVLPQVNTDGSIIYSNIGTLRLERLRSDSSVIWLSSPFIPPGSTGVAFSSFSSLPDSSGIAVGYEYHTDSTQEDWYVARITNMGIPYDPSQVVSVNPKEVVKPYAYPTPCRASLGFSGLRSPAKLELVDMQGRMVLTTEITSERMVDVSALVPGLYQYRLSSSGRVYSGRVMKE